MVVTSGDGRGRLRADGYLPFAVVVPSPGDHWSRRHDGQAERRVGVRAVRISDANADVVSARLDCQRIGGVEVEQAAGRDSDPSGTVGHFPSVRRSSPGRRQLYPVAVCGRHNWQSNCANHQRSNMACRFTQFRYLRNVCSGGGDNKLGLPAGTVMRPMDLAAGRQPRSVWEVAHKISTVADVVVSRCRPLGSVWNGLLGRQVDGACRSRPKLLRPHHSVTTSGRRRPVVGAPLAVYAVAVGDCDDPIDQGKQPCGGGPVSGNLEQHTMIHHRPLGVARQDEVLRITALLDPRVDEVERFSYAAVNRRPERLAIRSRAHRRYVEWGSGVGVGEVPDPIPGQM